MYKNQDQHQLTQLLEQAKVDLLSAVSEGYLNKVACPLPPQEASARPVANASASAGMASAAQNVSVPTGSLNIVGANRCSPSPF